MTTNILTFINKEDHSIKVCLNTNLDINEIDRKINQIENGGIYLRRLREQYKLIKKQNAPTKQLQELRDIAYNAVRLFCLDCSLLSFAEIELMEFEVNQSFS